MFSCSFDYIRVLFTLRCQFVPLVMYCELMLYCRLCRVRWYVAPFVVPGDRVPCFLALRSIFFLSQWCSANALFFSHRQVAVATSLLQYLATHICRCTFVFCFCHHHVCIFMCLYILLSLHGGNKEMLDHLSTFSISKTSCSCVYCKVCKCFAIKVGLV